MEPFKTDGCSGYMSIIWRKLTSHGPPWEEACVKHDHQYWKGGTKEDRRIADQDLLVDVVNLGYPVWAILMWLAVRIGGAPYFPSKKKWHCCDGRFKNLSYFPQNDND